MSEQQLLAHFPLIIVTLLCMENSWCVTVPELLDPTINRFFTTTTTQFMHNGGIAEFATIKRRLQRDLPDVAFDMVQGNTGMAGAALRDHFLTLLPSIRLRMVFCIVPCTGKCHSSPFLGADT